MNLLTFDMLLTSNFKLWIEVDFNNPKLYQFRLYYETKKFIEDVEIQKWEYCLKSDFIIHVDTRSDIETKMYKGFQNLLILEPKDGILDLNVIMERLKLTLENLVKDAENAIVNEIKFD